MSSRKDNEQRTPASEMPDDVSLPAEIRAALADEHAGLLTEPEADWPAFEAAMWARIDETAEDQMGASDAWPAIAAAIRDDHAAAIADFEAKHGEFSDGVALRWVEQSEGAADTLADVLRSEVDDAVSAKDGVWSAFAHQVLMAIDRAEAVPTAITDQAIQSFKAEVESELDAMAPRFDRDFREGIERRIFRAAREPWWQRLGESIRNILQPTPGFGLAAAAAAAAFLVIARPLADPRDASG